jgi:hypothetical protein
MPSSVQTFADRLSSLFSELSFVVIYELHCGPLQLEVRLQPGNLIFYYLCVVQQQGSLHDINGMPKHRLRLLQ